MFSYCSLSESQGYISQENDSIQTLMPCPRKHPAIMCNDLRATGELIGLRNSLSRHRMKGGSAVAAE